ncbi:MAG TPA: hypothetical protein VMV52_01965 [Candidatus Nanopelagicaceae bacterium]|nr:hypothetical protein [Candidatus Nanopelagicaceae bacterium]
MAGEYFVAGQLQRLGLLASVTYGNAKRADVIAFTESSDWAVVVEVKTTRKPQWTFSGRISTRSQKPWVFVHLPEKSEEPPRFFVLTQSELHTILAPLDDEYCRKYKEKNGEEYGDRPWMVNVSLKLLTGHENKWGAITKQLKTEPSSQPDQGE